MIRRSLSSRRPLANLGVALLTGVLPGLASAAVVPELSADWTTSNNVSRSTTDPSNGSQTQLRAGIDYYENRSTWNVQLRGALERVMYSGQDIRDGKRYGLYLRSDVLLIPDHLAWEVLDDLGLVATDPFGSLNPSDLQKANLFSTGPNLFLPFGVSNRLEMEARFSKLNFTGTTQEDNDRYSGTLALLHNMTPIRNVGLAVSRQHVVYGGHGLGLRNYNLDSAFFVLSSAPRRSAVVIQAGYGQVDDGLNRRSGPSGMLGIERRVSDFSSVTLFARMGYADAADNFRFGRTGREALTLEPQNVQATSAPFRQTLVNLDYSRRLTATQLTISPYFARESYQANAAQSRRTYGLNLTGLHNFTSDLQFRISGNTAKNQYDDGGGDSTDFAFGFGFTYQISRSLSLSLDGDRYIRSDSAQNFTENRASLLLRFRPRVTQPERESTLMSRMRGVSGVPTSGFRPEISDGI